MRFVSTVLDCVRDMNVTVNPKQKSSRNSTKYMELR